MVNVVPSISIRRIGVNYSKVVFCLLPLLALLSGCASGSLLTAYPSQIAPQLYAVAEGKPIELKSAAAKGPNALLINLENARISQIQGHFAQSETFFKQAIALLEEQENEARIDVSNLGEQGASLLVNDNALTYRAAFYEKSLAHLYQALNYAFLGDLEAAGVEVRRANLVDDEFVKKYENKIDAAEKKNKGKFDTDSIASKLQLMNEKAAKVKSSYVSAYAYYLSGLIYELRGDLSDAYIDYKKALELARDNTYIKSDVVRLGVRLGHLSVNEIGQVKSEAENSNDMRPNVIIIYEQDFLPQREQVSLPIHLFDGRIIPITFPSYQYFEAGRNLLVDTNYSNIETKELTEIQALAAKALKEQQTGIFARQVGRAIAKAKLQSKLQDEAGIAGLLVGGLYTVISSGADLRNWLSLPAYAHIGKMSVPEGELTITFRTGLATRNKNISVNLSKAETLFVQVIDTGNKIYINQRKFLN